MKTSWFSVIAMAVVLIGLLFMSTRPWEVRPEIQAEEPTEVAAHSADDAPIVMVEATRDNAKVSPSVSAGELRIVARGPSGKALAGASVALLVKSDTRRLPQHETLPGRSLRTAEYSGQDLLVWCEGYATRSLTLSELDLTLPEKFVDLEPEQTISGRVVTSFAGSNLGGIRIVAMERYGRAVTDEIVDVLQSVPRYASAITMGDGTFTIGGLGKVPRYCLVASGNGYVTDGIVATAQAGDREVRLSVTGLYGAQVESSVAGYPAFVSDVENDRTFVDLREGRFFSRTWLAGFSGLHLPSSFSSATEALLLATAPVDVERIEPAMFSIGLPGVSSAVLEVEMRRIRDHVPRFEHLLNVDCSGFGEVDVDVQLPYDFSEAYAGSPPLGKLTIGVLDLTEIGSEETMHASLEVSGVGGGSQRLRGVPFGNYRVAFKSKHGWFAQASDAFPEVKVGPEVASLRVTPEPAGAVHLTLAIDTQVVSPYDGPLRLQLYADGRDSFRTAYVSSPPYIVHCLSPRNLRIKAFLDEPWGEFDSSQPFVVSDCGVEAGRLKKVVLERAQ